MSLISVRYQCDETEPNNVLLMEVDRDTVSLRLVGGPANSGFNQAVTIPIHVYADAGRSGNGIHSRGIFITWTGEPPEGYKSDGKLFIPVPTRWFYRNAKVHRLCTYKGEECIIIGKRPEVVR